VAAGEWGAGQRGGLGQLGRIPGEIQLGFEFQIFNGFGIWQDFGKLYKEI
jgi:hypothetical protein